VSFDRLYRRLYRADTGGRAIQAVTSGEYAYHDCAVSASGAVACVRQGHAEADEIYLSSDIGGEQRRLTSFNSFVDDLRLADSGTMRWKRPDGWEIEGLLIKPVGYVAGKRYPLIL